MQVSKTKPKYYKPDISTLGKKQVARGGKGPDWSIKNQKHTGKTLVNLLTLNWLCLVCNLHVFCMLLKFKKIK